MLPHESDSGSENDDDLDEESALGAPAPAKKGTVTLGFEQGGKTPSK